MSEQGYTKPQSTDDETLHWSWLPSSDTDTSAAVLDVPDTGRRTAGWSTSAADRPDASHVNWLFRELTRAVLWIAARFTRHFDDLYWPIVGSSIPVPEGHRFVIDRDDAPHWFGEGQNTAQGAAGATSIDALTTDGGRVYYNQGSTVYAARATSPDTALWSATPDSPSPAVLEACGDFVLCLYAGTAATQEIHFLDPADGSDKYVAFGGRTLPSTTTHPSGACNGDVAAFATGTNARTIEIIRPSTTSSLTAAIQWGNGTAGEIVDMAIDHDRLFVTGTADNSGNEVAAYPIDGTTSALWSVSTAEGVAIDCDGEYVYVATVTHAASAADTICYCLNRTNGAVVWEAVGEGDDAAEIAVDQRYVYLADTVGGWFMLDKRTGQRCGAASFVAPSAYTLCCDGVRILYAASDDVYSIERPGGSVEFQAHAGNEVARAPFHNLATPVQ